MRRLDLHLASTSPRRRDLLEGAGLLFGLHDPAVEEIPRPDETAEAFARRAALDKAEAVAARLVPPADSARQVVLGCDTVVVLDGEALGKPRDAAEARGLLRRLSGRGHRVVSGLGLCWRDGAGPWRREGGLVSTEVIFRALRDEEIEAYVRGGDPFDKAGAYGIQRGAAHLVRAIHGSYTNVVGLPLAEVVEALNRLREDGVS